MLNMSRNTVKKYLQVYQKSGLSLEVILSMDDSSLCSLFQEKDSRRKNRPPVTRNCKRSSLAMLNA